jgi:hypothetical protein
MNRWQPVTNEYQTELVPLQDSRSWRRKKFNWRADASTRGHAEGKALLGAACITWFYFLSAAVYFLCASMLLSYPFSRTAAQLIKQSQTLLPFPIHGMQGLPTGNTLSEAFFFMAVASAVLGVLWLVRFRPVRWITLCISGISLVRSAEIAMRERGPVHSASFTLGGQRALYLSLAVNALIFLYVALYPGVDRAFRDRR